MKKTNKKSSLLSAEFNVNFDVKANVKIGKGGGGYERIKIAQIIKMIILLGFLPNHLLVYLVSRWLNFWS
jgi:hypothetical protein